MNPATKILRTYLTPAGQTAARNLLWLVVFNVLSQACAFASVLLLTNGLGRERFGVLAIALNVQMYLMTLGSVGVPTIVIRDVVQDPEQLDRMMGAYLVITGVASVILGLVTSLLCLVIPLSPLERGMIIAMALGNVAVCLSVIPFYDVAHRQPRGTAIIFLCELGSLLAISWLYRFDWLHLPSVTAIVVAKWTLATAAQFVVYHWTIRPIRPTISWAHIHGVLKSAWPLLGSTLVCLIPLSAGIFFVRMHHGNGDAAILGIAIQITAAFIALYRLSYRIVLPHIFGPYGFHAAFVKKLLLFYAVFLGLLFLAATFGSYLVIVFLLPPEFNAALLPTVTSLAAGVVTSGALIAGGYVVALRQETRNLRAWAIGAICYVAGCVLLVPEYSYHGAAAMSLCAGFVSGGLLIREIFVLRRAGNDFQGGERGTAADGPPPM